MSVYAKQVVAVGIYGKKLTRRFLEYVALETKRHVKFVWHKRRFPRKFTPAGRRAYGFRPRSEKYRTRKKQIKGHEDPLRWSGRTKDVASRHIHVAGMARIRSSMTVPWYARQGKLRPNMPDIGGELGRVSERDLDFGRRDIERGVAGRAQRCADRTVERF